jgi:hypothetical protein
MVPQNNVCENLQGVTYIVSLLGYGSGQKEPNKI